MKRARWITWLLVAVALGSTAGTMCGGWTASASERMACCTYLGHPCSQAGANDCCAASQQGETRPLPSIAAHSLTPVAATIAPQLDPLALDGRRSAPRILGSPPDLYLLFSVFLI